MSVEFSPALVSKATTYHANEEKLDSKYLWHRADYNLLSECFSAVNWFAVEVYPVLN